MSTALGKQAQAQAPVKSPGEGSSNYTSKASILQNTQLKLILNTILVIFKVLVQRMTCKTKA